MTLATIRTGIQTRLQTISGLRVFDRPPDSVNDYPCALILPKGGEYDTEFGAGTKYTFEITILVSRAADVDRAQTKIDPYIDRSGAKSVYAAVDGDVTLGGAAETCRVTGFKDYGGFEYGGILYFGVKFDVEIWE